MLKEMDNAPLFDLPDNTGKLHALKDLQGKMVVVYFYPKDDTPGCTREACDFRDNLASLAKQDCVVLGISRDNGNSHQKFKEKYQLNFTLLSDSDQTIHQAYDALEGEKVVRSTFLINQSGKIAKIWRNVKVDGHVAAVLQAVNEMR